MTFHDNAGLNIDNSQIETTLNNKGNNDEEIKIRIKNKNFLLIDLAVHLSPREIFNKFENIPLFVAVKFGKELKIRNIFIYKSKFDKILYQLLTNFFSVFMLRKLKTFQATLSKFGKLQQHPNFP